MPDKEKKPKLVSNTRIYLEVRKLLDEVIDTTPEFPKAYKYTVGSKMHELCISMLQEVAAAYLNRDLGVRIAHLTEFQTRFETLKALVRVAGERRWIKGVSRHARMIELADSIGRQSTAWKNSLVNASV